MKELIFIPAIALLIIGFAFQLQEIAESSSEKTLDFADDMNKAMDCATLGKPIRECSPDLLKTDFSEEVNATITILEEMEEAIEFNEDDNRTKV